MSSNRFEGRVYVVTGGASGIGAATARKLHAEGAKVVVVDLDHEDAARFVDELGAGPNLMASGTDVADQEQVSAAFDACVERFGLPDGLVNSAGIGGRATILDVDAAMIERTHRVHLLGSVNTTQAFARLVTKADKGGAVVNVSSTAGIRGLPGVLPYAMAKHGVVGLTRASALELGAAGIRVNAVAPGTIRTPMTAAAFNDPDSLARIKALHPVGRAGEPEEVAGAIAFLLSEDASFITGAILPVDGGLTVGITNLL